jgi:signal transduction histidine kinase
MLRGKVVLLDPLHDDLSLAILDLLCERSGNAAVLVDESGRVLWHNRFCGQVFEGCFSEGRLFVDAIEEVLESLDMAESTEPHPAASNGATRLLRHRHAPEGEPKVYRHDRFPLAHFVGESAPVANHVLHSFCDVSYEKKLEQDVSQTLRQLTSMKEIVDILYGSMNTQDVIHIILVGVTCQMGLGFNRAFFLQAKDNKLKGRIGIGPSDPHEANDIWSRIAERNFSSLREVYEDLVLQGGISDLHTQELAVSLEFDVSDLQGTGPESEAEGLSGAIHSGKPTRIHADGSKTPSEARLFEVLKTDVLAVVPLSVQGELGGVIIADNFITRQPISEAALNSLKTFAWYAAMALERSSLYEDLQESVNKLKAANDSLKQNQQRLLQAEKLSAVGELAAKVSHEIRTPLVAIGGLARSLLSDPIGDNGTRETLEVIGSEVSRLERFLGVTLDFVKPEVVNHCPVDLQAEIQASLATFKTEIEQRGIAVRQDFPSEPIFCCTDPDLFHHTLTNLIKNAIEAMESGGTLYTKLGRKGLFALVGIGDTGVGIPAEARAHIFEPYFTTKPGGTGLGLAIAAQSVRINGGRLELADHPEFTTLFELVLPLEEAPADSAVGMRKGRSREEFFARRLS